MEQLCRGARDAKMFCLAPLLHAGTHLVDELVFLNPVLRPLGIEVKLILALLLGLGDGDEVRTDAALLGDFVRDALVGKPEVSPWFLERRVDDRIFDDDLLHGIWR